MTEIANDVPRRARAPQSFIVGRAAVWESIKDDVMRKAVSAKFSQHDDILAILPATANATIVEHTENDSYWGDGGDGSGKNMLGRILMEVREGLKTAAGQDAE
jgi:hypothetical protein